MHILYGLVAKTGWAGIHVNSARCDELWSLIGGNGGIFFVQIKKIAFVM